MLSRCTRWSVLLVLLATTWGLVSTAPPADAYASTNIHLGGHGWGHGRGLGQWGALGYAIDYGWAYSQILDHYYGGTTSAPQAQGLMTVRLTEEDDVDMIMTSGSPFQVDDGTGAHAVGIAAGTAVLIRHTSSGWLLFQAADCGGGASHSWGNPVTTFASSATPRVGTAYGGDDITLMMKVCGPTGNVHSYRGILTAVWSGTDSWLINSLPTEQYLRGVVPRESPAYWGGAAGGKGIEALKAQAVAARSYAVAHNSSTLYKICDTTACQVYGGAGLNGQVSESPYSDTAVSATAGEVRVTAAGAVVSTEFSSSTGGYTAGVTFPAVVDDGDAVCDTSTLCNPNHNWGTDVTVAAVQAAYPTVGTVQAVTVTSRNGLGTDGGRAVNMKITGSSGSATTTGSTFQAKLNLKSTWFTVADISISVSRLYGADREATSIAISKDLYADGTAKAVVLASAWSFPDALVGAPLADTKSAPILLTDSDQLSSATLAEIGRATGGHSTVYLLGGTAVLSPNIETQLTGAGYTVQRYGGASRYETAVLVADALGDPATILEATGLDYPDALAAGAAAAHVDGAVLLTQGPAQASATAAYLQQHKPTTTYAIGGQAAQADPAATKSFAGTDRYDTAYRVALNLFAYPPAAGLASGQGFADALAGAVHAVHMGGPLVLTAQAALSPVTRSYLQAAANSSLVKVVVYGGTAAVSDQALTDINTKAG